MSDQGGVSAGWYPDPSDASLQRYWDGNAWTEHTAPVAGGAAGGGYGGGYQGTAGGASTFPTGGTGPALPKIDTWLWQSIVTTLLCCSPIALVGIVFAAQAQSALNVGNVAEARSKAGTARLLTLIGLGVGLLFIVGWFAFVFLGILSAGAGGGF